MKKNDKRRKNVNKGMALVFILAGIFLSDFGFSKSLFYYEDFSSAQSLIEARGWDFEFSLSRDFYVDNTSNEAPDAAEQMFISNQPANSRFIIDGDPNAEGNNYDQWFTGEGVLFRPSSNSQLGVMDATPEEPFGFEIIRYVAAVHQDEGPTFTGNWVGNLDDDYGKGLLEVWLVADNGANADGDRFDDYVMWYDKAYNHDNVNNRTNNVWGYYYFYENDYSDNNPWPNMTDLDGNSMDPNPLFRTQYSYGGQVNDELGIRMTHNGSKVTIYLNLDPAGDSAGYQNSWIKFAETSVAFANNLITYFGTESPTPDNWTDPAVYNKTYAEFGNFVIRTVASNLMAKILTSTGSQYAVVNQAVSFVVHLEAQGVTTNDSGIGEVHIAKPVGYGSWDPAAVTVSNDQYGVLTTITNGTPANGQVLITTNGDTLSARFFMQDAANNNIVTNGKIYLGFTLTTPSAPNGSGDAFSVYADCVKHADTGQDWIFDHVNGIKYATTGEKKAFPAAADALKIYTFDQPKAHATLECSPNPLLEGNEQGSFTFKLSTVGLSSDNPMITKARIKNPDTNGFLISNVTAIAADGVLGLTNVAGDQYIYIFYTNNYLPGFNGFDKIQFNVYGTPNIVKSTNIWWPIEVTSEDAVGGTTWQLATNISTSNFYQQVSIFTSNAQIEAKISPTKVAIFVDQTNNEVLYSYTVQNTGIQNDVLSVRISIPADYDILSLSNLNSSLGNAVLSLDTVNRYLYVYYTNVNGGQGLTNHQSDLIQFLATHTNTNTFSPSSSASFVCEADNGNGLGYSLQKEAPTYTWSVNISPPSPSAENLFVNPVIDTSVLTNVLTNRIYNTSPKGVGVKLVTIEFATNHLELLWASNRIDNGVIISNSISGITNTVYIHYGAGTNLPSIYENPSSPPFDEIYLKSVHSYSSPALESFPTFIYRSTEPTNDSTLFAVASERVNSTNTLHIEYPFVNVAYYIQYTDGSQTNVISTTVETNSIVYFLTNQGNPGNKIHSLRIPVPSDISTNIKSISVPDAVSTWNVSTGEIEVNYTTPIDGGETSLISFVLIDHVADVEKRNIYFYPWISNDRELVYVNDPINDIVPMHSGKLDWLVPKPKGGGGAIPNVFYVNSPTETEITQQIVLRLTNMGEGSDQFKAVKVDLPLPLYGSLRGVSSAFLAKDSSTYPALFDLSESNFIVIYTNDSTFIPANGSDDLTLTIVVSNLNALPTNGIWKFYANNGLRDGAKTFFDITNVQFGSTNAYGTEKLDASLSVFYLTTETNKDFTFSLFNGPSGSLDVKKIHIVIPTPFTVNSVTRSAGKNATISFDANNIWLTYSDADLLGADANTILAINASKPVVSYSTNVDWTTRVIYSAEASSNVEHQTRGNTRVNIIYPQANFYAYMETNDVEISKDFDFWEYDLIVTNVAEVGNNIYRLKILPPDAITNVTSIVSSLAGSFVSYTNGDGIYIDYQLNGTNLVSGAVDVIQFVAYDNQTAAGYISNWIVKAANFETNAVDDSRDPAEINRSLNLSFITPHYSSAYYVTPSTISTVMEQSDLSIQVANNGDPGNDIKKLRITLPTPFVLSGLSPVSTLIASSNVIGSNFIDIFYTGTFGSGSNDTISFTIQDDLKNGDMDSPISLDVNFNTSADKYIPSSVSGGTGTIHFAMPPVEFYAYVDKDDEQVSKDFDQWDYDFTLTNVGALSNRIYKVRIDLPSGLVFTNVSQIQTTLPAHTWYSNAVDAVFIDYGVSNQALEPDSSDRITLTVQDATNGSGYTGVWGVYGANWKTNDITTPVLPVENLARSLSVAIITPNYGAGYLVSPNDVSTVMASNQIQVYVNNIGSGSNFIESVRIQLPEPFITNDLIIQNTKASTNVIGSNEVVLYYTNTFAPSEDDTIQLWLRDSISEGNVTNHVSVGVNYNTSADKEIPAQLSSGENAIRFNMPETTFIAYVHPDDVNIGKDYDVYDYRLFVTNTGGLYNYIRKIVILPPTTNGDYLAVLTNVAVLSNRIPAEIIVSNNGMILVNYFVSNQCISNDDYDAIVIRAYDNQTGVGFDGDWQVLGLNATNGEANVVGQNPALINQSLQFTIVAPDYASTYEVIPESDPISAFLPQSDLTVSVNNAGSGLNDIESVRIYLDAPYLTNNALVTTPLGGTVSFGALNGTNFVQLDYSAGRFAPSSNDNIVLTLKDDLLYGNTNADIRVYVKYVSSAGKYLPSTLRVGGDNTVHFVTPAPSYYAYVRGSDVTVDSDYDFWDYHLIVTNTGDLSNHIVRLKIVNPDSNVLTNLQVLSHLIDAAVSISNMNEIYVDYALSNSSITNGGFDEIVIRAWDNNTSGGFASNWTVMVANYTGNAAEVESLPEMIGETLDLNIVFPGYGSTYFVTPSQISTFLPENDLTIHVNNVGSAGNVIEKVRVYVPNLWLTNNYSLTSDYSLTSFATNINGSNFIEVTYTGGNFLPSSNDNLVLTLADDWTYGNTNARFSVETLYNRSAGKFKDCTLDGGDNLVTWIMPGSDFYAWLKSEDRQVYMDTESWDYHVILTNTGDWSNHLYRVRVDLPSALTNVSAISGTVSATRWYSNSVNAIFIEYQDSLPSLAFDELSFTAWDNQPTNGYVASLVVSAANNTNDPIDDLSKNPGSIGESLQFSIVNPGYESSYTISPTEVSSLKETNDFVVYLNNVGSAGNDIVDVEIKMTAPVSNLLNVSDSLGGSVSINQINGTNEILIHYPSGLFVPLTNSQIHFTAQDGLDVGETNMNVSVRVHYSTSGSQFKTPVLGGGTNVVSYRMPKPQVSLEVLDDEVYVSQARAKIRLKLVNEGEGSNLAEWVRINLPNEFTNAFSVSGVSDSLASNVVYDGANLITLYYAGMPVGTTNVITLDVTNTMTTLSDAIFSGTAYNGVYQSNLILVSDKVSAVKAPSAELLTPTAESILLTNVVRLVLNNNTSGSGAVRKLRIEVPPAFTNIVSVSGTTGIVSNGITNVTITYPSGLSRGSADQIELVVEDQYDLQAIQGMKWTLYVQNSSSVDAEVRESYIGALEQDLTYPAPNVTNIYLKTLYYVKHGSGTITNHFELTISNRTLTGNNILSNRVVIPVEMQNIIVDSITNTATNVSAIYTTNDFVLDYAGGLKAGEVNTLSFDFINTVLTPVNTEISVYSYNLSPQGNSLQKDLIFFKALPEPTEVFIGKINGTDHKEIYSLDHRALLEYRINNGMYDTVIDKIRVHWQGDQLILKSVYSSIFKTNLSFQLTSSNVWIDYTAMGGLPARSDTSKGQETLIFDFIYTNLSNWTNQASAEIFFHQQNEPVVGTVPDGDTVDFAVLMADFGRWTGVVKPESANPLVKLYYAGTKQIATNKYGEQIVAGASAEDGVYSLDLVPVGVYDIGFSGDSYRETFISNKTMMMSTSNDLGEFKMRRETFSPSATTVQNSPSLDDENTEVIVPPGSLASHLSLDIWKIFANEEQQLAMRGGVIQSPIDPATLPLYHFEMEDAEGRPLSEESLNDDVVIVLHYDESAMAAQGWDERNLAIYYWKPLTGEWVRLGGALDTDADTLTAKVSYLHEYYVILGESARPNIHEGFESVTVNPKVFTPSDANPMYGRIKINMAFTEAVTNYVVRIFSLRGDLIKTIEKNSTAGGDYKQGEVYWDGLDNEGYPVSSGVYVYRIFAGNRRFSGTLVIAR